MAFAVHAISLASDGYSPMRGPHGLPALRWPKLAGDKLDEGGADAIEEVLRAGGWDPQWRFSMYRQAHYHSTTHELLIVIAGQAIVQLGGTDERARPRNDEASGAKVTLSTGDVLLLPAGYSHRLCESKDGFTMVGSYPKSAQRWDMRFPNVLGCPHDCEKIKEVVVNARRKGLFDAQSPELFFTRTSEGASIQQGDIDKQWSV